MIRKGIFLMACMVMSVNIFGQDRSDYIEQYKSLAVAEMLRTGIPASIKLAQAMLESNCGKSDLACKANNHFGIKCGNDWKGKSYKKEDDDYEEGKLVKSCFREFPSVYDSYLAHSEFLMDPSKSGRYGFLFDLNSDDYKGWAKGLSKAGYATDPQYAHRLIDLIEKYELFKLDVTIPEDYASASKGNAKSKSHSKQKKDSTASSASKGLFHNDVRYTIAKAGDTPESIAEKNDVTVQQVVRYNDDIENPSQLLAAGSRVYLQPKRTQNNGKQKYHLLKPGEDLVTLSQHYGIRLDALQKRNGLGPHDLPAPNQKILLKGKSKTRLRTMDPYDLPSTPKMDVPQAVEETVSASPTNQTLVLSPVEKSTETVSTTANVSVTTETPVMSHAVAKGETLYSIARMHGITVSDLKKINNLSTDTISIGQTLMLK